MPKIIDGVEYRYKGWFGLCPVYISGLASEAPHLAERHVIFLPLMWLSEFMFSVCFSVMGWFDPDYEPAWPIRITGKLE